MRPVFAVEAPGDPIPHQFGKIENAIHAAQRRADKYQEPASVIDADTQGAEFAIVVMPKEG